MLVRSRKCWPGHPDEVRRDFGALVSLLRRVVGPRETVPSLHVCRVLFADAVGVGYSR